MGHTHLFVCSKSKRELPRAFVDDSNHALSCHRTLVSLVTQGPVVSLDVFPRRRGPQSCRCMSSVTNKASSSVHVKSHDRYTLTTRRCLLNTLQSVVVQPLGSRRRSALSFGQRCHPYFLRLFRVATKPRAFGLHLHQACFVVAIKLGQRPIVKY